MSGSSYKKYMKKSAQRKDYSLVQLFAISFFGMLLLFTFIIKSFSPSVDVSIGDYKQEPDMEDKIINVDNRLSAIQDEDQGKNFADLMKKAEDTQQESEQFKQENSIDYTAERKADRNTKETTKPETEMVYKVFIGTYTSAEQAKVAKDIIQESNLNLNPIVKCIGSNNYTLQVGIFKNKSGAESLLTAIQQNHLPGRIVQED
jgi:effector-binding domain-containing protein